VEVFGKHPPGRIPLVPARRWSRGSGIAPRSITNDLPIKIRQLYFATGPCREAFWFRGQEGGPFPTSILQLTNEDVSSPGSTIARHANFLYVSPEVVKYTGRTFR
jgi:hypothetical protein